MTDRAGSYFSKGGHAATLALFPERLHTVHTGRVETCREVVLCYIDSRFIDNAISLSAHEYINIKTFITK